MHEGYSVVIQLSLMTEEVPMTSYDAHSANDNRMVMQGKKEFCRETIRLTFFIFAVNDRAF
jgi:hypothetical protein